ncbi:hypothetical protein [Bacillus thuringiensis]|nr:hypothetical protein [Bacillus thuringiensis]
MLESRLIVFLRLVQSVTFFTIPIDRLGEMQQRNEQNGTFL